jgi:hypothetical protein
MGVVQDAKVRGEPVLMTAPAYVAVAFRLALVVELLLFLGRAIEGEDDNRDAVSVK